MSGRVDQAAERICDSTWFKKASVKYSERVMKLEGLRTRAIHCVDGGTSSPKIEQGPVYLRNENKPSGLQDIT